MNTITVKPAPGRTIRDPDTGLELKEPTVVSADSGFWIRCIAAGDVLEVADKPASKEAK